MSDHGHGHETTTAGDHPFSPAEWADLQKADVAAARAVVVLMGSIFMVGIVLYAIVAYVVAT